MVDKLRSILGRTEVHILLLIAAGFLLIAFIGSWAKTEGEDDLTARVELRYQSLMSEYLMGDIDDLTRYVFDQQWEFTRIAIPGTNAWTQPVGPIIPFDLNGFDAGFLDGLVGFWDDDVPIYELTVALSKESRQMVFLNADDEVIHVAACPYEYSDEDYCGYGAFILYRFPDLFGGRFSEDKIEWMQAAWDPSRVIAKVSLIPQEYLYDYLLAHTEVREEEKTFEPFSAVKASHRSLSGGGRQPSNDTRTELWRARHSLFRMGYAGRLQ